MRPASSEARRIANVTKCEPGCGRTHWCCGTTHRANADVYISMPRHRFFAKRRAMTGSGGALRRSVSVQSSDVSKILVRPVQPDARGRLNLEQGAGNDEERLTVP